MNKLAVNDARLSTESAPDVLKPLEAARFLRISERSLWTLMQRKQIKSIRIGRSVRYSIDALREFISARENQTDNGSQASTEN